MVKFEAKELGGWTIKFNFHVRLESFFKVCFDGITFGEIDNIVYIETKVDGRFTWKKLTLEDTWGMGRLS